VFAPVGNILVSEFDPMSGNKYELRQTDAQIVEIKRQSVSPKAGSLSTKKSTKTLANAVKTPSKYIKENN